MKTVNGFSVMKVLFILVFALAMVSNVSAGGAQEAEDEKTKVTVAWSAEPISLNPIVDIGGVLVPIQRAVMEPMVKLDRDLNYIPWLAESWEQVDPKTWHIKIQEGVEFHSGNPLNAESVAQFFDFLAKNPQTGPAVYLQMLDEAVAIDEYVVEFRLKRGDPTFLDQLTRAHIHVPDMVKEREMGSEEFGEDPSGTGPYIFKSWKKGSSITFEANPNYWRGKPEIDELEILFMPETSSRVMALETGEVDITHYISPQQVPRLEQNPEIEVLTTSTMRPMVYTFNMDPDHPILSNKNVRKAITYAFDKKSIAENVAGAAGSYLDGFVDTKVFGGLALPQEHDPEMAHGLLVQEGWEKNQQGFYEKDGEVLTLRAIHPAHWSHQREVGEGLQQMMREFGIKLDVNIAEVAKYREALFGDDMDAELLFQGMGQRTRDSEAVLQHVYCTWGEFTAKHYNNPEVDRLMQKGLSPISEEERREAYHELQRLIYDDYVAVQLYLENWIGAKRANIKGFEAHPLELPFWERLEKE